MNGKSFILSSSGLKNIVEDQNEFTFIFGKTEVKISNTFEEFISPLVSRLHHSDPTINSIHFTYPSKSYFSSIEEILTKENIKILQSISRGTEITINSMQVHEIQQISILFCNDDLFESLQKLYPESNKDQNFENILTMLELFQYLSNNNHYEQYNELENLINNISSNFHMIDQKELKKLSKPILYKIISNENLKLSNEDSLLEFIEDIFQQQDEYNENEEELCIENFYEFIDFSSLSEEKFKDFVSNFDPNKMTISLWRGLCNRFLNNKTEDNRHISPQPPKIDQTAFDFFFNGNKSDSFHGIIHELTQQCGGDVADKGVVNVTAYHEIGPYFAKNAVDLDNLQSQVITNSLFN